MKKLFSIGLALLTAALLTPAVLAADMFNYEPSYYYVVDEADVLTDQEEEELNGMAEDLSQQFGYDVVLYYAAELHDRTPEELADDYYDYNGYGVGETHDGILLMVCPATRDYYFSCCGNGIEMFYQRRLNELDEEVVEQLSDNEWMMAGYNYYTAVTRQLNQGMPEEGGSYETYEEDEGFDPGVLIVFLPIDLLIALLVASIIVSGMKRKLNSVHKGVTAGSYIPENGVEITASQEHFITKHISRRVIETRSGPGESHTHMGSSGTMHSGHGGKF